MRNELYLCFLDYTKAFECVKHQELIKLIESLNADGKYLRVIRNLYWQKIAAVHRENEVNEYKPIPREASDKGIYCTLFWFICDLQ